MKKIISVILMCCVLISGVAVSAVAKENDFLVGADAGVVFVRHRIAGPLPEMRVGEVAPAGQTQFPLRQAEPPATDVAVTWQDQVAESGQKRPRRHPGEGLVHGRISSSSRRSSE